MFIEKLNKSVILTYLAVAFGIVGMFLALEVSIEYALICLIIAGILDLFDGVVARKMKRTENQKKFGVQIDSLCDVINFLVLPIIIFLGLEINNWYEICVLIAFVLAGVTRLAHFNVMVENINKDNPIKYYEGLPVTYISLIMPSIYLLRNVLIESVFNNVFILSMLIIGVMYVLNIKILKPRGKAYVVLPVIGLSLIVALILM